MNPEAILDSEIQEMEKTIISEFQPQPAEDGEKIPPPPKEKAKKPFTKAELIKDILDLETKIGGEISDEKKLRRLTKTELEKHMAEIINGQATKNPYAQSLAPLPDIPEAKAGAEGNDTKIAIRTLNNINLTLVAIAENLSISFKEKTAGIELLKGWTNKVKNMDSELNEVFAMILQKYGANIQKYVDPLASYAIIMMSSASVVVNENYREKKKDSEKN
jgi:hypothetical protein